MVKDYSNQAKTKITTRGILKISIFLENIMYIQCDGDLAMLFLNDRSKVAEIKTLKEFEEELSDMGFIRVSRNTIVNCKYITKVNTNHNKRIVYLGGIVFNISRRRLTFLKKHLF